MAFLTLVIGNKNDSSWSLRPWLALKQFDFSFDEVRIPLYVAGASEQIRQYCPHGSDFGTASDAGMVGSGEG